MQLISIGWVIIKEGNNKTNNSEFWGCFFVLFRFSINLCQQDQQRWGYGPHSSIFIHLYPKSVTDCWTLNQQLLLTPSQPCIFAYTSKSLWAGRRILEKNWNSRTFYLNVSKCYLDQLCQRIFVIRSICVILLEIWCFKL